MLENDCVIFEAHNHSKEPAHNAWPWSELLWKPSLGILGKICHFPLSSETSMHGHNFWWMAPILHQALPGNRRVQQMNRLQLNCISLLHLWAPESNTMPRGIGFLGWPTPCLQLQMVLSPLPPRPLTRLRVLLHRYWISLCPHLVSVTLLALCLWPYVMKEYFYLWLYTANK